MAHALKAQASAGRAGQCSHCAPQGQHSATQKQHGMAEHSTGKQSGAEQSRHPAGGARHALALWMIPPGLGGRDGCLGLPRLGHSVPSAASRVGPPLDGVALGGGVLGAEPGLEGVQHHLWGLNNSNKIK